MQIYKVHVPLLHQYLTLWLFILGFLILVVSFKILILLWRVNVTSLLTPPSYKHISVKITSTEVKKTGKTCQWEQILPVFNLLLFGFRVLSVLIPSPNWSEETMRFWFTFRTDFTHNIQMLAYLYFFAVLQSNQVNSEHQEYFWNVIVFQENSQSGMRKLNCKQGG